MTHIRERFRALPGGLRLLVWIGIATGVGTGIAIPVSSTHGGHGGPVTAHGAAAPATTTSTAVRPTTATTTTTVTAPSTESEPSRLRVAAEGSRTGYERRLFPQWIDADRDGCDTRHEVLIAESVVPARVGAGCAVTGRWYSAYDGVTTTDPSTFDIDHVVPRGMLATCPDGAPRLRRCRRRLRRPRRRARRRLRPPPRAGRRPV